MTFLERFVRDAFKAQEPSAERCPAGGWLLVIPVPIVVRVKLTDREVAGSKVDARGFLNTLAQRARDAIRAAEKQYEDGAEIARLRERVRILEDERRE